MKLSSQVLGSSCSMKQGNLAVADVRFRDEGDDLTCSHQVFTNLLSTARFGLYHTDTSGRWLDQQAAHPVHVPDSPDSAAAAPSIVVEDLKALYESWQVAMESGLQWSREFRYRSAGGTNGWLHATVARLHDSNGAVIGYAGCNVDITARVAAQQEIALSEDRHRLAIEASKAGVWDLDVEANHCYFSPRCFEMLGYAPGRLPADVRDWRDIIHPEDLEVARKVKVGCIDGSAPNFRMELRLKTHEGKWVWFLCNGKSARRDRSGMALRVVGTLIDITERKMFEQMLRMERDLMDVITTTSPVGIVFVDRAGSIAFVNPRAEQILGLSKEEIMMSGYDLSVCQVCLGGEDELPLREILTHGATLPRTCYAVKRADGQRALLSLNAAPFLDTDGEIGGTVLIMEDVTEQRQHEQELANSDRLLRETQRIAQLGSYVLELATDTWNCSSILTEILGMDGKLPLNLLGHFEIVHPEFRQQFMDSYLGAVMNAGNFEMEYKIIRQNDGAERWVAECCELKRDDSGCLSRLIGTIQDITERKAAEEAIRELNDDLDRRVIERTSQLAAAKKEIESFSYSVSHDLRAPLRHINSYSAILLEEHGSSLPPESRYYLDRIRTASSRMGMLIDDLLTLTRVGRTVMKREHFDISALATEVASMLQEAEQSPAAVFTIAQGLKAHGDSTLVRLVLENLLGNALKYSANRDARIEFGKTTVNGKRAFFVRDNGVGFDMAYAGNLFQPFQRLHGSEFEGTGIGLATVRRIIERHGGAIWAEGKENEGATFYFTLSGPQS